MDDKDKISLLYDRHERSDAIELRYKYLPLLYIALLIAVCLSLISWGQWTNICMSAFGIVLIVWIVGMWRPTREANSAMKAQGIVISGSKFSFKNPLTVVIKK